MKYKRSFAKVACAVVLVASSSWGQSQVTTRVSVDSGGAEGDDGSYTPSMSGDGRYVAFESEASNLVPGDTNGVQDIFVHDRQISTTTRVSVGSGGAQANGSNYDPSFSADGRYVAFTSDASNLVLGDTNVAFDIFVHDRQIGATTRVSVGSGGAQANGSSFLASISADGHYVAFQSAATNLVPGDTNGVQDVFVHDRLNGMTTRESLDSLGAQANDISFKPAMSAHGGYVAFHSLASNLVPGDSNGFNDIFVRDRPTGTTTRVSVDSAGGQGNGNSNNFGQSKVSISGDGRYVAFTSDASNLVLGDTNSSSDVFVHDRQTGATTRVSVDSAGGQGDQHSKDPWISADGRFVAFSSMATNLVSGDTNMGEDVFLHDRQSGAMVRVNVSSAGAQCPPSKNGSPCGCPYRPQLMIAFQSSADTLVPGDTNIAVDIFVRGPGAAVGTSFCFGDATCPCGPGTANAGCQNENGGSPTGGAVMGAVSSGGAPSVTTDSASTQITLNMTNAAFVKTAIFFEGGGTIPGTPFGDGLICINGVIRLNGAAPTGDLTDSVGTLSYPNAGHTLSICQRYTQVTAATHPTGSFHYQAAYRDPTPDTCGGGGGTINISSALTLVWGP